jgi:hypothetical protein
MGAAFDVGGDLIVEGIGVAGGPAGVLMGLSLDMAIGIDVDLMHAYACE